MLWRDADRFVRRRLAAVILPVVAASVLTALAPLVLKWLVDGFAGQARNALSPSILVGAYVLSQFLAQTASEVRGLVYTRAERRVFRVLSGRLFAHIVSLPLRFHPDRKTRAVGEALENGLTSYQLIVHRFVFTILPVTAEFGTIIIVLVRLAHPAFLSLFCGALVCYAAVFAYAAKTIARSAWILTYPKTRKICPEAPEWGRIRHWSLWDMINFVLTRFVFALKFIDQGIATCHEGKFRRFAEGMDVDAPRIVSNLKFVEAVCRDMSLESALDRLERIDKMFKSSFTYENIENELIVLRQTIEDGIKFERFYHYPKVLAELPVRIDADWANTLAAFPSKDLRFEIRSGIDCYALGHATAAIFHFMRVVEFGLRALARERRIKLGKDKPIEWGTWQEILQKLSVAQKGIEAWQAGNRKDAALGFYTSAIAALHSFKNEFRNMVMHVRKEYELEDAGKALRQVRDFMNGISARVGEDTKGSIKKWL